MRVFMIACMLMAGLGLADEEARPVPQWDTGKLPETVSESLKAGREAVPADCLSCVTLVRIGMATRELKDAPWVAIEDRMVSYYSGYKRKIPEGRKAYLVRGVFSNEEGRFQATVTKAHELIISYRSLEPGKVQQAAPLVVLLEEEPQAVYVIEEKDNGRMPGLPLGILDHEIWTEEKARSFVQVGKSRIDIEDVLGSPSSSTVEEGSTEVTYTLDDCYVTYPKRVTRMVFFSIIYKNEKVFRFNPAHGG